MGSLTPGATYIYERDGSTIYAREFGKNERTVVGYDTEIFKDSNSKHFSLWNDILAEAERNPALQQALDKVIMLYRLSKDNPL
jgi:hypothetical protein